MSSYPFTLFFTSKVAFFFRKVNEELFIKREMGILCVIAAIVVVATVVIEFVFKDNPKLEANLLATVNGIHIQFILHEGIALVLGFGVATILPVIYAARSHKIDSEEFELPSGTHLSNTASEENSLGNHELPF